MRKKHFVVRRLGRVEYEDGLALMDKIGKKLEAGEGENTLLLLEHPPVLTLGRGAKRENLLLSPEEAARRGVEVHETNRGGDVTYHGPGQIVGYPIFDLRPDRQDVRRYVREVEEVLLRSLAELGIQAGRIPKWTGVWVGDEDDPRAVKIGAIGINIRKWVTRHGFALNVRPDLSHFGMIVPCGIQDRGVTSISEQLGKPVSLEEVEPLLCKHFGEVFGWSWEERDVDRETVAVAVLREGEEPEVLVLERLEERGGFQQIVTGKIEAGESPEEAARREVREETGLALEVRSLGYRHAFGIGDEPLVAREHAFVAVAPAGARITLDASEHRASRWLPVQQAKAEMPFAGLRRTIELASASLPALTR